MKRLLLPITISLLAAPAMAENKQGQIVINPAVSYQKFDNGRTVDEASGFGIGLEYQFGEHWAAEVAGFQSEVASGGPDVNQYKVDGLYYFSKGGTVQPYLGFGVGNADFDSPIDDDETQVNAGLGLRFNFSDSISARWDVRGVHGLPDDNTDMMTTLGLSFGFGGKSEPKAPVDSDGDGVPDSLDQCTGTVAGAPVGSDGCALDSDGDGVADYLDQCSDTPSGAAVDANGCVLDSDGDGVSDDIDQCPGTEAGAEVDDTGCVGVVQTLTMETIQLSITFPSGSDVILTDYQPEIQKVADFMQRYIDVTVDIEGHTDSQGSARFNKSLSQRRADSVKAALVSGYGIAADRINAIGYGEEKPIASNDTAEGRQANRRVVAVMQKEVMK